MSNFTPTASPYLRVIKTHRGKLIVLGTPGRATFDISPHEGVKLGLALIENSSHILQQKEAVMSDQNVLPRITKIFVEHLGVKAERVTPEAKIDADLGADSLDHVDLIMTLEEEFRIQISDERAEKITTVGEAIEAVTELLK